MGRGFGSENTGFSAPLFPTHYRTVLGQVITQVLLAHCRCNLNLKLLGEGKGGLLLPAPHRAASGWCCICAALSWLDNLMSGSIAYLYLQPQPALLACRSLISCVVLAMNRSVFPALQGQLLIASTPYGGNKEARSYRYKCLSNSNVPQASP